MKHHFLPQSGTYYKASMHTHTTISDGRLTPEETKKAYMDLGYSIVAYTDHEIFVPHNDLSDEKFVAINSYEVDVSEKHAGIPSMRKCYHLNLYAKDPDQKISSVFSMRYVWNDRMKSYVSEDAAKVDYKREYSVEAVNDLIEKANADGFLVCYNHPLWSQQNYTDYAGLRGLWGVEVYNHGCVLVGYRETPQPFVDFLHESVDIAPICADDAHHDYDCGGGWLMVNADKLDYVSVMKSLQRGDFYSSTGPEIYEFSIDGNTVHVSCSEAVSIAVATERRSMRHARGTADAPITEADFDLSKFINDSKNAVYKPWRPFIRLEVVDKYGNTAYTRPYYADEFAKD